MSNLSEYGAARQNSGLYVIIAFVIERMDTIKHQMISQISKTNESALLRLVSIKAFM
jgi:hypothetical protein